MHAVDRELFADDGFQDDRSGLGGEDGPDEDDSSPGTSKAEGFEGPVVGTGAFQNDVKTVGDDRVVWIEGNRVRFGGACRTELFCQLSAMWVAFDTNNVPGILFVGKGAGRQAEHPGSKDEDRFVADEVCGTDRGGDGRRSAA